MPIYEYFCSNDGCDKAHDFIQKFNEADQTTCPVCETETLSRNKFPGRQTFNLKGKGFYKSGISTPGMSKPKILKPKHL